MPKPTKLLTTAGMVALVGFALSACGGGSNTAATAAVATTPASTNSPGSGGIPGTSGKIAEVDPGSIEIQSTDSQTTVNYTASTSITAQTTTTLAAVKAGECVTITDSSAGAASSSATATTAITATSVRISAATNGSCTIAGAAGGFGGGRFGGNGTGTPPSGGSGRGENGGTRPSGAPTGGARTRAGGFGGGIAFGTVSSVSGSTIVVNETSFRRGTGSSVSASPSTTTSPRTVTVTPSTTYTTTAKATSAALVVGKCATARGKTDSTGTIAATSLAVSDPVNGSCTAGFGGFQGGTNNRGTNNGGTSG